MSRSGSMSALTRSAILLALLAPLWRVNAVSWKWTKIEPSGDVPPARQAHGATFIDGKYYLLGGYTGHEAFNTIHRLDVDSWTWETVPVKRRAEKPGVVFPCVVSVGTDIYTIGGWDNKKVDNLYNDVWVFNTTSLKEKKLKTTGDRLPRIARHSCAVLGSTIWVTAGWDGKFWLTETYSLDVSISPAVWTLRKCKGFTPYARAHSVFEPMPLVSTSQLWLFGGGDGNRDFDDLYVLDTSTLHWHRIANTSGSTPSQRTSMAGCVLRTKQLLVHGGYGSDKRLNDVLVMDAARWTWNRQKQSGSGPKPRMGHTCTALNSTSALFFGGLGEGGEGVYGDMHLLQLHKGEGKKEEPSLSPSATDQPGAEAEPVPPPEDTGGVEVVWDDEVSASPSSSSSPAKEPRKKKKKGKKQQGNSKKVNGKQEL